MGRAGLGWWAAAAVGGCAAAQLCAGWADVRRVRGARDTQKETTALLSVLSAANVAVFGAWRVPQAQRLLQRWFVLRPDAPTASALLSVFSHRGAAHLAVNTAALWGLGPALASALGGAHLLAAHYVSCGLLASLGSVAWMGRVRHAAGSLGASGALFGVFSALAVERPETRVALLLVPGVWLPVRHALAGLASLDAAGLLLGWRVLDHAAHLSGALSGVLLRLLHHTSAR